MTTFMKRQTRLQTLVILLACTATLACVQKPVMPSGAARVPINSDEMIQQYRERVKSDQHEKQERSLITRQLETLMRQVHELSAALTLVQFQQQELARGKSRSGRTINTITSEWKGPLTSAAAPHEVACPAGTDQSLSATEPVQSEEDGSKSTGTACRIGPSTEASLSPAHSISEEQTNSWRPRVIELSEREQVELHRHSIIFRVSERTGRSEFLPSKSLQSHLKQVMKHGPFLHVRGYTDGDKDRWIEHETAKQRAYKARAYLISQGYAPNQIEVTIIPIGEHVADNATKKGRAKNRRVEIEVKEPNPASIWAEWYG